MAGLNYYTHAGPTTFRFELAGSLTGADARRLDQAWRTASSTVAGKVLSVNVTLLDLADEKGRDLFDRGTRLERILLRKNRSRVILTQYRLRLSDVGSTRVSSRSLFVQRDPRRRDLVSRKHALDIDTRFTGRAKLAIREGGCTAQRRFLENVSP